MVLEANDAHWLPAGGLIATLIWMRCPHLPVLLTAAALIGCAHHHKSHRQTDDATLTQADLPANVEKSFDRDHPTATIKQIDRQTIDSVIRFRITYMDDDGTRHQALYDREGDTLDAASGHAMPSDNMDSNH